MSIFEKLIPSKRKEATVRDKEISALEQRLRILSNMNVGAESNIVKERAAIEELMRRLKNRESIVGNRELERLDADFNSSKLLEKIKKLGQEIEITRDEQEKRKLEYELFVTQEKLRHIL